jgi:replicative superfamily II helicase
MVKELDYYEDQSYLDELNFRQEIMHIELVDHVNTWLADNKYKYLKYEHLELKDHYSDIFVKDINWSTLAACIIEQEYNYLINTRPFKVIIARYGLDPWIMFTLWSTEDYIELHDNYLSQEINNRLWKLKEYIEDKVNKIIDGGILASNLSDLINDFNNYISFFVCTIKLHFRLDQKIYPKEYQVY